LSAAGIGVNAAGIELEVVRRGEGRPIVLLHGAQNVDPRAPFLDLLGQHGEVIAPSHPGFGRAPRTPIRNVNAEGAIAQGLMFAGNPDTVYRQIMDFYEKVGGFEHLILMGRSGFMTHGEAEKGIRLVSKEVLPRLREVT